MAFDFPNSPSNGQVFSPSGGPVYVYTGGVWRMQGSGQVVTAEARNRIVNGAMQISQEVGDSGAAAYSGYTCDQWMHGGGIATSVTYRNSAENVITSGNKFALASACPTGKPSLAATEMFHVSQRIEGGRVVDFRYGSAAAKQAVLRFTIKPVLAGTYCVAVRNADQTRSGLFEFTVAAGEVGQWTVKSVVITGDTTGTWLTTTGVGLDVSITYACGTTYQGVAGWQAGNKLATANQVNAMASSNVYTYLTDVGLYLDPNATGVPPPWQMPDEAAELAACKRYYYQCLNVRLDIGSSASTIPHQVDMRITPALTSAGTGFAVDSSNPNNFTVHGSVANFATVTVNARM